MVVGNPSKTGGPRGVVVQDELTSQVDVRADMERALRRASLDLAHFIEDLIKFTARPGRVLTGRTAPYWPIFTGISASNFEVEVNINHFGQIRFEVNNRVKGYPERVNQEQKALEKFFAAYQDVIDAEYQRLLDHYADLEVRGRVPGFVERTRFGTSGRVGGRAGRLGTQDPLARGNLAIPFAGGRQVRSGGRR